MIPLAYISRETLERIFFYSTALHDLNDINRGSAYHNGEFLEDADQRRRERKKNLRTRSAITQVCRGWRYPALKYRFEHLVIDSKCSETWLHVLNTLEVLSVGRHVRRLELDAFDSSVLRVKSAAGILRECRDAKYISLSFPDDSRRRIQTYEYLLSSLQVVDARSLEHFHCDFGCSFEQASIIINISKFSNLKSLTIHSAFGFGSVSLFDMDPLELAHLCSLQVTTTKDAFFLLMSDWSLPSLRDLSIFNLRAEKSHKRFFRLHGTKLRTLALTYIEDDAEVSTTLCEYCPNLEELVVSVDGIPYTFEDGITCSLSHNNIKRIGIRDADINTRTIAKTMAVLNGFMRMFTNQLQFPRVQEIRLLDFQRELWMNIGWKVYYVELWLIWIEKCEDRKIQLQAADGKVMSFAKGMLRILESEEDMEYGWLSLRYRQL